MTTHRPESAARANDEAVAAYLMRHPDFLVYYPEVLAKLHIPHGSGGAVSLIERQVVVLREQLGSERGRLNHLVARAREYEALSARIHELTLKLILARDLEQVHAALEVTLSEEFSADAVALKLFPVDAQQRPADPMVRAFIDFIDRDRCLCGPLAPEQSAPLFGDEARAILSAALVPIKGHDQSGVLAIGSRDPHRFTDDMGTELLERLGAIAGAKLHDLSHRETGPSAEAGTADD